MVDCTKRNFEESKDHCKKINCVISSFHSDDDIKRVKDKIKCSAYIGATSDGNGNWRYVDGSSWWSYSKNDGLAGTKETKVAWHTDGKWHDWATGDRRLGVVCGCEGRNFS